jgi:hypothetical protein
MEHFMLYLFIKVLLNINRLEIFEIILSELI